MRGDHEELKILLQIFLIASRINQKLKNKGENTSVLKWILARKFGPFDAVVGAVSHGIDHGFNHTINQPRLGGESASIVRRSGHDQTSIVSHDCEYA